MKKIYWISIIISIAVIVAAAVGTWVTISNVYTLSVTLTGAQEIVLEYGQTYEEPGASAVFFGSHMQKEPIPVSVTVTGAVDSNKLGTYQLSYTAEHEGYRSTAYRQVKIVDTEAPVITLVSAPDYFTPTNTAYKEEGFSAQDNYDGDLTGEVERHQAGDMVTYTVRDSSGNETSVTRQILYRNPEAPDIKLTNGNLTLLAGERFEEPGYYAYDAVDGDLTETVQVSGQVNNFIPGEYFLTYTAVDSEENSHSVTRKVIIKERTTDKMNDPNKHDKIIFLTFDDGPGEQTPRLLDIMKKYNVHATFFVVNTKNISTVKRAAEEGHAVGIHSASHKFEEIYASESAYFADLNKMGEIIESYTGQAPNLIRFPGGSSNTRSNFNPGIMTRLVEAVEEKGYYFFDWNVDSNDAGSARNPQAVYDSVIAGVSDKKQSVVLMHDIKIYTIDAIEQIIVWGLENGYTFLPLSEDAPGCHHRVFN